MNSVRNPSGRLFKITSRDVWQVFLNHAREASVPNLCCRFHLNGMCNESCFFRASHVALTGEQTTVLGKWIESCRAHMPSRQPAETAKKPKLVGNSDNAYSFLPAVASERTLQQTTIGMVAHHDLLARSTAAQLYALTRYTNHSTLANPCRVAWADRSPAAPSLVSPARQGIRTPPPNRRPLV